MFEIRIHGRGSQGIVTAAELLSVAAFNEGRHAQAFPSNDACPAGENAQRWLYHAEERDYEAAWRQIMADNPFPAIMGRVCYHPCQTACNRATMDEAVGINAVERFLGDEAIRRGWTVPVTEPRSGKQVLVVGAGPAGLAAAYHLNLLGHDVTVRDGSDQAGGMMRFGIPAYRLPRDVLDLEVARIVEMGVTLELDAPVGDLANAMRDGGFDAAFLAMGAQLSKRAYIPAGDSARVLDALSVLRGFAEGDRPQLGRRVVVYGGGRTAMDVARTARRLGATPAACPVATASNATTATACARTTPSLSWDRGSASGSIWTTARVAASALRSAHAEPSS